MGWVSRFGNWLDYLMAEKALRSDVLTKLGSLEEQMSALRKEVKDLAGSELISIFMTECMAAQKNLMDNNLKLRDELNAVKALLRIGGARAEQPKPGQKFDGSEAWKR